MSFNTFFLVPKEKMERILQRANTIERDLKVHQANIFNLKNGSVHALNTSGKTPSSWLKKSLNSFHQNETIQPSQISSATGSSAEAGFPSSTSASNASATIDFNTDSRLKLQPNLEEVDTSTYTEQPERGVIKRKIQPDTSFLEEMQEMDIDSQDRNENVEQAIQATPDQFNESVQATPVTWNQGVQVQSSNNNIETQTLGDNISQGTQSIAVPSTFAESQTAPPSLNNQGVQTIVDNSISTLPSNNVIRSTSRLPTNDLKIKNDIKPTTQSGIEVKPQINGVGNSSAIQAPSTSNTGAIPKPLFRKKPTWLGDMKPRNDIFSPKSFKVNFKKETPLIRDEIPSGHTVKKSSGQQAKKPRRKIKLEDLKASISNIMTRRQMKEEPTNSGKKVVVNVMNQPNEIIRDKSSYTKHMKQKRKRKESKSNLEPAPKVVVYEPGKRGTKRKHPQSSQIKPPSKRRTARQKWLP